MVKQFLHKVQSLNTGGDIASFFESGNHGFGGHDDVEIWCHPRPRMLANSHTPNANVINASTTEVADASPWVWALNSCLESHWYNNFVPHMKTCNKITLFMWIIRTRGHVGSPQNLQTLETAAIEPLVNTTIDIGSQLPTRKDKHLAKKRKGEAEKLLVDQIARPTWRALAIKKDVHLQLTACYSWGVT